jgi:hypothetical protein
MYLGPPIDDVEILALLPLPLRKFLEQTNGYIAFHGGLHVRGACLAPEWHSLRWAWIGDHALYTLFPVLNATDVPFAQDALGDQYVLRDRHVQRLDAETGELTALGVDLAEFDIAVRASPIAFLNLAPLERFRADGGILVPGQLLSVYPPYCVNAGASDRSFRAVRADDRIRFPCESCGTDSRSPRRSRDQVRDQLECQLTGVAADGGVMERAEALAALVSTARSYWIRRS